MSPFSPAPKIIGKRRKRRQEQDRSSIRQLGNFSIGLITILSVILAGSAFWGAALFSRLSTDLPTVEQLPIWLDPPNGHLLTPTRIYDRSGQNLIFTLENPRASNARYLSLDAIPEELINAILASNDPQFWEHPGFQTNNNSTLATRLITSLFLTNPVIDLEGRWRLNLLAAQATSKYGQDKILEWYLNSANFGHLAYGVDQAAWVYYDKSAVELTLGETALLASIADAPTMNPIDAPQIAVERQNQVLQTMIAQGYLTPEQAANANTTAINIQPPALQPSFPGEGFVELALSQLYSQFGEDRVKQGGFEVITSLNFDLQIQTACAAQTQLGRITAQLTLDAISDPECESARLLPTLPGIDLAVPQNTQVGLVVLDSQTGQVLALSGNPHGDYPPGTLLTPFIYLTGFTRGLSPASLLWDIPNNIPTALADFGIQNRDFQGPMRLRTALANDYLAPAFQTLIQVGPNNAWRTAQQSGMTSLNLPNEVDSLRMLLDSGTVNLLEATHAYGMFSNQGILAGQISGEGEGVFIPTSLLTVRDPSGRVWLDWTQPSIRPVISAQLAHLITDILSDELARRPTMGQPNDLETGRPSAAKLSPTYSQDHVWTVGYSPQRVVGVWLGIPKNIGADNNPPNRISPAAATGLWNAVFKTTHEDLAFQLFEEPIGINHIDVCDPSGLLPTADCPQIVSEIFIPGNEPIQTDNLFRAFLINRQTKLLATIYTPQEFVEERVYLVFPPEAEEWAKAAGIEVPPDSYDVIFNPSTESQVASLNSPENFSYISGEVSIGGTAGGETFSFYRVRIGEGLNPRQWLQIGNDSSQPVLDNQLATWDTTGLNGLYAIQLQVVNQDQSIETAILQVTVDNQPPQVQVTFPSPEQVFNFPDERDITLQAQVGDNLDISKVEFYIDATKISSLVTPPYAVLYQGTLGKHVLRIIAYDLSGNETEFEISFALER